jgi:hypothetical protein
MPLRDQQRPMYRSPFFCAILFRLFNVDPSQLVWLVKEMVG